MSVTFKVDNVEISAVRDRAMFNTFADNQSYVVKGVGQELKVTSSTSSFEVTLGTGEAVICGGSMLSEGSADTITLTASSSGYLVIRVDVSQTGANVCQFKAVSSLVQQNINDGTHYIYDLPLYQYQTNANGVTSLTDVRQITQSPGYDKAKDYIDGKTATLNNNKIPYQAFVSQPDDTDFNTLITSGSNTYRFDRINITANTNKNQPLVLTGNKAWNVVTFSGVSSNYLWQTAYFIASNSVRVFIRPRYNSNWGSWIEYANKSDITTVTNLANTKIPYSNAYENKGTNIDFDTLVPTAVNTLGFYRLKATSAGTNINAPVVSTGTWDWYVITLSSTNMDYVTQYASALFNGEAHLYIRSKYAGTWKEWSEITSPVVNETYNIDTLGNYTQFQTSNSSNNSFTQESGIHLYFLQSFKSKGNQDYQIVVGADNSMWFRFYKWWGNETSPAGWQPWTKLALNNNVYPPFVDKTYSISVTVANDATKTVTTEQLGYTPQIAETINGKTVMYEVIGFREVTRSGAVVGIATNNFEDKGLDKLINPPTTAFITSRNTTGATRTMTVTFSFVYRFVRVVN